MFGYKAVRFQVNLLDRKSAKRLARQATQLGYGASMSNLTGCRTGYVVIAGALGAVTTVRQLENMHRAQLRKQAEAERAALETMLHLVEDGVV